MLVKSGPVQRGRAPHEYWRHANQWLQGVRAYNNGRADDDMNKPWGLKPVGDTCCIAFTLEAFCPCPCLFPSTCVYFYDRHACMCCTAGTGLHLQLPEGCEVTARFCCVADRIKTRTPSRHNIQISARSSCFLLNMVMLHL